MYVGKQNWEKFLAIDFHISVTQCERKYTAFASKLLQTQTKSIIFTSVSNPGFKIWKPGFKISVSFRNINYNLSTRRPHPQRTKLDFETVKNIRSVSSTCRY